MRRCASELPEGRIEAAAQENASVLSQLSPDFGGLLRESTVAPSFGSPPGSPEEARFRLFDAFVTFLTGIAADEPLLIVIDDLHWADEPSLRLFEFISRSISGSRITLVGACRDVRRSRRDPFTRLLGELSRAGAYTHIALRPLDLEQTGRLVRAIGLSNPSHGLLETIRSRTGGNPFFISEVARLVLAEPSAENVSAAQVPDRVPDRVRDALLLRLDSLPESADAFLDAAAIAGMEFDQSLVETVVRAAGIEESPAAPAMQAALDQAVAQRITEGWGPVRPRTGRRRARPVGQFVTRPVGQRKCTGRD